MSNLPYTNYPIWGDHLSEDSRYSQAVRIPGNPSIIKLSGQGGWDPQTGTIEPPTSPEAIARQVEQAFANVDLALRNAGCKNGWGDVYLARVYMVGLRDEGLLSGHRQARRKWHPNHRPLLTVVEVKALVGENMRIEIEVEAFDAEARAEMPAVRGTPF